MPVRATAAAAPRTRRFRLASTGHRAGRPVRRAGPDRAGLAAASLARLSVSRRHRRRAVVGGRALRSGGLRGGLAQAGQPARLVPGRHGHRRRPQPGRQPLRHSGLPGPPRHAAARLGGDAGPARLGHRRGADRGGHPDLPRRQAGLAVAAAGAVAVPGARRGLDGQRLRPHRPGHRPARHPGGLRRQPARPGQRPQLPGLVEHPAERGHLRHRAELAARAGRPGGQLPALVRRASPAAQVAARRVRGRPGRGDRRDRARVGAGRVGSGWSRRHPGRLRRAGHHGRGHLEVPAVRHRPDHQPDPGLRDRDRAADRRVRRPGAARAAGPAVPQHGRGGRLHAGCGGAVRARSGAGSSTPWTGGSTGPATTPTRPSPTSPPGCRTRWTWTRSATTSPGWYGPPWNPPT